MLDFQQWANLKRNKPFFSNHPTTVISLRLDNYFLNLI